MNEDKIKKDLEEIETINIELDHRVSKLIAENEHLKQTYKQLYDSIKQTYQLTNFVNKFLGTVKFGNDHVAKILGYVDYQIRNVMISRVYYVRSVDLLTGSRGKESIYTSVSWSIMESSLYVFLSKAHNTKSGLWR
ncbi:hypothetical protein Tco_1273927 [Tanacetum coccineum]